MDCEWKYRKDGGKGSCIEARVKWDSQDPSETKIWYTMKNESDFYDNLTTTTGVKKELI
jgi:hypothetical protein